MVQHIPETPPGDAAGRLLQIAGQLRAELHPGRSGPLRLDSGLERDVGLDSLARAELLLRVETAFGLRLPEGTLGRAETLADLLAALGLARPEAGHQAPASLAAGEAAAAPAHAATLIEVLHWHAEHTPGRSHIVFLDEAGAATSLSYGELLQGARHLAAGLAALGVVPGQRVAIMLPSSLEFFHVFFGVLLAGAVPVPLYPPASLSRIGDHLRRQAGILNNCEAVMLITVPAARALSRLIEAQVESLRWVLSSAQVAEHGSQVSGVIVPVAAGDLALLQYTSGSTGSPKGVALTHANLLANIRAWSQAIALSGDDVCVSWLPLYHDMGLIGAWLGSLYNACSLVLMSPLTFLARPEEWLWAIHRYRGTVAAAPNFAYELCLRRLPSADLAGLDLTSWRLAANGAEPVSPATIENFCQAFAAHGFRRAAMAPVYGLAENAVGLAVPPPGRGPLIDRVQRAALAGRSEALPAAPDDAHALRFVACGRVLPGHDLRVVDDDGRELPERRVGRLQFRGPSATAGYYRNPEANRKLFQGEWLETGDVAYLADGDLYLTSRSKDIIIRGGRNLYPHELETAIGGLPGVRRGCVAVFGAPDPVAGTERLIVAAETRESAAEALAALRAGVEHLAQEILETPPDAVCLLPPGSVLKTSSGKIRRAAMRELYLAGRLGQPRRPPWLEMSALAFAGAAAWLRRRGRQALGIAYGAWVWSLAAGLLVLLWPLIALPAQPRWGWAVGHHAARLFLRLSGLWPRLAGGEQLPATAAVLACNHASYLDGVVLIALLRRPAIFVAKRELSKQAFAGRLLRGLGCEFVERFDAEQGLADAGRLQQRMAAGASLIFFPEGTFTREAGLRNFHLGAFDVAARRQVPLVPIALSGLREALRDETWLPRRRALAVHVGPPLQAADGSWEAMLRLRDEARAWIAAHCGEPDLGRPTGA